MRRPQEGIWTGLGMKERSRMISAAAARISRPRLNSSRSSSRTGCRSPRRSRMTAQTTQALCTAPIRMTPIRVSRDIRAWSRREKIEGRGEHSYPGGGEVGAQTEHRPLGNPRKEEGGHQGEEGGKAQVDGRFPGGGGREDSGAAHAVQEDRDGHQEARQRTRHPDIEEGLAAWDSIPDPDEGAERTQDGDSGDEIGKARIDSVAAAGQVVAHFVGEKNGQYGKGIGDSAEPERRTRQDLPPAEGPVVGVKEGSGNHRRDDCGQEQPDVKPEPGVTAGRRGAQGGLARPSRSRFRFQSGHSFVSRGESGATGL